ncbi:uncharacterized protein B0H18DRAFT_1118131 [Fomitopsis serialis]|uniref:uncharacterized protein n=1 Tax=Fomitopsis serialis TaxID=139415 RepID=UPI0020081924|nr:uncharacterized protein B0H18DRAFT_1118131 [Neoantrodia serialis]KAH9928110.1 hypothetical protein B0H18DRAFT_1118131 [Neoantrodia serialis]
MGAQLTRLGHVVPGPLSLDRILNAQGSLPNNACGVVPAAGQSELPTRSATATSSPALSISPPPSRRSPRPPRTTTMVLTARSLCQWQPPAEALDTFARSWASSGGTAYVGMYTVGASYPSNSDVSKCTDSGSICHQDDIEIIFGTAPTDQRASLPTGKLTSGWYATRDATGGQTVSPLSLAALARAPPAPAIRVSGVTPSHFPLSWQSSGLAERARVVPVLDRAQPTSRSYERLAWDHPFFSSITPLAAAVSLSRFHLAEMKAERLELK